MKRSKMINQIKHIITTQHDRSLLKNTKNLAETILDFIEKQGMLPPTVNAGTSWYTLKEENGTIIKTKLRTDVNQWEPEDETK